MIVTLDVDIFFTKKLSLFLGVRQDLIFNIIQYLLNRKEIKLLEDMKLVCPPYIRREFITYIHTDNEFEHLRQDLIEMGIYLNICSVNEHIPEG